MSDDTPEGGPPVPGWPEESAQRLAKARALRQRGIDPYPTRYRPTHTFAALVADHGEKDLAALLETKPIVSRNERLSFFNLAPYQQTLQVKYSEQELSRKREQVLYPVMTSWEGGFSGLESQPGEEWRWCGPSGELVLKNPSPYPRRVTVEMSVATGSEGHVRIESPFFTEQLKAYPEPQPFSKTFDVPPGRYSLKFASDAQKVDAPNDPRTLIFRLINFRLKFG